MCIIPGIVDKVRNLKHKSRPMYDLTHEDIRSYALLRVKAMFADGVYTVERTTEGKRVTRGTGDLKTRIEHKYHR